MYLIDCVVIVVCVIFPISICVCKN